MKKVFYFIFVMAMAGLFFTGCKKDNSKPQDQNQNDDQGDNNDNSQTGDDNNDNDNSSTVELPAGLFIVGDAVYGNTDFPVPDPEQKFTKTEDSVFQIITYLETGKSYYFTSENQSGSGHKYAVADNSNAEVKSGAAFTIDEGENIPSPDSSHWFTVTVDFTTGKYTVEAYDSKTDPAIIPDSLYIVGDAVAGGWANPIDASHRSGQTLTKINAYEFTITLALTGEKEYKFISKNDGSWSFEVGVEHESTDPGKLNGYFKVKPQEANTDNIPSPDEDGTYKIDVNFLNYQYTLTKQ